MKTIFAATLLMAFLIACKAEDALKDPSVDQLIQSGSSLKDVFDRKDINPKDYGGISSYKNKSFVLTRSYSIPARGGKFVSEAVDRLITDIRDRGWLIEQPRTYEKKNDLQIWTFEYEAPHRIGRSGIVEMKSVTMKDNNILILIMVHETSGIGDGQ